jgi:L-alanine-DL-glutamate epimerase-like enolase superfamily enzyme
MKDLEIDRVQVYAVGPETERFTWASNHTAQYVTNTIIRITTRGGLEGVAGAMFVTEFGFTAAVAETVRRMLPLLIGTTPFDREKLWYRLQPLDLPMAPQAQSIIDIALWDLTAKLPDARRTALENQVLREHAAPAVACRLCRVHRPDDRPGLSCRQIPLLLRV